jgi:hypothetical protein
MHIYSDISIKMQTFLTKYIFGIISILVNKLKQDSISKSLKLNSDNKSWKWVKIFKNTIEFKGFKKSFKV